MNALALSRLMWGGGLVLYVTALAVMQIAADAGLLIAFVAIAAIVVGSLASVTIQVACLFRRLRQ